MRIRASLLASLFVFFMLPCMAQQAKPSYESTEVADGLYMLQGVGGFTGGNLGLMTGEDGIVLIDDGMPNLTDLLLSTIAEHAEGSVSFLINTHVHGDHIGGNEVLAQSGATIVSHHNIRRRMIEDGVDTPTGKAPAAEDALPILTFADSVNFHLNGRDAFVFHVEQAHTDGDAVIHFRKANVIHTGDVMFNGLFPFIDLDSGGNVEGYIAAQKRILALASDDTKIIPGHGPLASKADLQAAVDMLVDARDRVAKLVAAGQTEEQILAANPLADYHDGWNWGFITTERMTKTLIRSLTE
jgi:glyoxylase-like metal-dependent hydrolase (beta-lactamase superfamily II)